MVIISKDTLENLQKHILYIIKNVFKMRKNWLEAKLDQSLCCTMRQNVIESGIIDKKFNDNDVTKKEKENEENLNNKSDFELSNTQSYTNAIKVTRLR